MPEFFCELLSEEIPSRLQSRGAEEFARLFMEAFAALKPAGLHTFHGPRRIALTADIAASIPAASTAERGPRTTAPEAALQGFLRKHGAAREVLRQEGDFWVLHKTSPSIAAQDFIAASMPALLRRFAWPKSMRWGGTSAFTWIRPLRRICCVLAGEVVGFTLAAPGDDGHGLIAGNLSEGHRQLSPGTFRVTSAAEWQNTLRQHHVIADATQRERLITAGITGRAEAAAIAIVPDDGLISEVAGLVEWPVALLGRIDDAFMDLPPEVMQVSMRVNQRYFATRMADGSPAPYFAFIANIDAPDGGSAIIAGNERVLRARFSDARHFWDLDRRARLEARVVALDSITFHAKLGTQGARVRRLVRLADIVATAIGTLPGQAARAALLAKADLTTGMVSEFPELQGVMGAYYARHDGEDAAVCDAIRDHYAPRGPADPVPANLVSAAVALADKLDQLVGFFSIGEKPTGSGDPYALRRAALGVIRILREHGLHVSLSGLCTEAALGFATIQADKLADAAVEVTSFVHERLRIVLKSEGHRTDVIAAAANADDERARRDLVNLSARAAAVSGFIEVEEGRSLLAASHRISSILQKGFDRTGMAYVVDQTLLIDPAEQDLDRVLVLTERARPLVDQGNFTEAMLSLASMRPAVDAFFDSVHVNDENELIRQNRLQLLAKAQTQIDYVAKFELIAS